MRIHPPPERRGRYDARMGEASLHPGWYPDPSGSGQQRYFDGADWGPYAPPPPPHTLVQGPNPALPAIATLLTLWACGGWLWVWLFIAANNKRTVTQVDSTGRVVEPAQYQWIGEFFIDDDGYWRWGNIAVVAGVIAAVTVLAIVA